METSKNCIDNEDNDGDVLKQETQDLAGLLSSPEAKLLPLENSINPVKAELNPGEGIGGLKDEIKEENSVKQELSNPGSVGKLPNGDANPGKESNAAYSLYINSLETQFLRPGKKIPLVLSP